MDQMGHHFGVVLCAKGKVLLRRGSESTGQLTKRHEGLSRLRDIDILVANGFGHVFRASSIVIKFPQMEVGCR